MEYGFGKTNNCLTKLKRYIYLISPQKIRGARFYSKLDQVLKTNKVKYFQLRLKKISTLNLIKISRKIKRITKKNNVKFLINDKPAVARRLVPMVAILDKRI